SSATDLGDSFHTSPVSHVINTVEAMRRYEVWIQLESALNLALGGRPVPGIYFATSQGEMSFSEVVIQFDRLERRSVGLWAKLFLWQYVIRDKATVTVCQCRIDQHVTGINRNSLLVVFDGFLCVLVSALNPKSATLEVEVKRLRVDGTDLGELLLLGVRQSQT